MMTDGKVIRASKGTPTVVRCAPNKEGCANEPRRDIIVDSRFTHEVTRSVSIRRKTVERAIHTAAHSFTLVFISWCKVPHGPVNQPK